MRAALALPGVRERIVRAALRESEIIPFGQALAFDPRSWVIKQTAYGFRIWVALGERSISREIMLDTYERSEAAFVSAFVQPGDRVVDIGANIGFYTALLGTLVGSGGRVIACEPLDSVVDALEATVAENGYGDRVSVLRVAVSDAAGRVSLRHAPVTINAGAAYLAPPAQLPPGHVDVDVEARTLDEIVGEAPCRFIKLDAEGAEPRILAGAARTLAVARPTILTELNPELLARVGGVDAAAVIAMLRGHGYGVRRLADGRLTGRIERYDGAATVNVVCEPLFAG